MCLCYIHTMCQLTWAVLGIQPALFGVFAYVSNMLHAKEQSKVIILNLFSTTYIEPIQNSQDMAP